MKKRTVPQPSQANDGRERPQTCKGENNESERNNDNTNTTTGRKDHSQNTKKLNLENVSEGQSGSSSINNNKDNNNSSSHESENIDITKEHSCRNRKKRKRSKAKENKNNKGPMKDSTESKSKLNHNSNPEDSSEGHIISQTGSTSFACNGKRETKGISNMEEDSNIDKTNKPSGSKSEVEIADRTNPDNISKGQTNNTRAILQERNPKQKKKEKRSKTTSSICDTTINRNENNTNKTTEGESLLQGTGTLNLEVISDSHSSSCNNNSNSNSNSNNNNSNDAITKEHPCENIIKGKWSEEEEENKSNKDLRKSSGSKSEVEIADRANHEASAKSVEAISHDRTAKRKSKEKRSKRKSRVRDSTVNKNDNKCDGQDLQRYFKAVESVNDGHEKRHEESTKSDSTEDNRITKNSKKSTECRSELKSKGKPCPQHTVDAQGTGARPKVYSTDRNGTKERKFNKEVCRQDKTVNTNGNKSDKKDLDEYFKAVESTNEGDFCIRTTEHDTNKRRGRQVSSSRDQGGDKLKTNKKDKKLSTATKDTPDQFIIFVKTIAYQMIGNIERQIENAKLLLEKKQFTLSRQKTFEAMAGAQEAKDQLLLSKNEFLQESNLADWFGTCAFILDKTWDFLAAAECFYIATVFDPDWTEQKHHEVSSVLWGKIVLNYLDPENLQSQGVLHLLLEMDNLTQVAESRCRWKVCINICHDALKWETFLRKKHGVFSANPLNKIRRLALSHFKMGEYKAAQTWCMSILNDLTEFDDFAACEIWARSLFLQHNYDVALTKVELGLSCAKTPEDKERLTALKSEIQSSIAKPKGIPEQDEEWLNDTLEKSQPTLEKSLSETNLSIRKTKQSSGRNRRSKANVISEHERVTSSHADCKNALRSDFANSMQNSYTTVYLRKSKAVPSVRGVSKPETKSPSGSRLGDNGLSTGDSDSDGIDQKEILFTLSSQEAKRIEHIDETSFYEKTRHMFNRESQHSSKYSNESVPDERLLNSGVILNLSYMRRFREKPGTPFYKSFLEEGELLQRLKQNPTIYKRCILQIDGSHLSYCYPIDSKDSGVVVEICGRSKAGQTYNEDEVVVELLDRVHQNKERRYGRVVGIMNRQRFNDIKHPVFLCTLDDMDSHLMRPLCKTVPKLNILHRQILNKYPRQARYKVEVYTYDHTSQTLSDVPEFASINPGERNTYLFLVALIRWNPKSIYPQGAVIRMLNCGSTIQQGLVVLDLKHKVPSLYKRNTFERLEGILASYDENENLRKEYSGREDLCDIKTFTIDPPGSQDLDDALSIEETGDGFKVGVHIADVSALVRKNDPIDLEAYERSVTYYPTISRPRNMLPEPLSSNLCSLLPNRRRRTVSLFFLLDDNGTLLKRREENIKIVRSVIKSGQNFTYKEIQSIIDNRTTNSHPLKNEIIRLFELAKKIRQRRLGDAMYALDFENEEVTSEDSIMETFEAHFLVEEFMIMANQKVAELLTNTFPSCTPIRSQPPPTKENMESFFGKHSDLVNILVNLQGKKDSCGKCIRVDKIRKTESKKCIMVSKTLWETFKNEPGKAMQCLKIDNLFPIQHIVNQNWISIQERAEYKCSDGTKDSKHTKHFSLNMYPYTHFTSPIRRYNDLVVHRLLIAALEGTKSPYSKKEIEQICAHINSAMKRAKEYQRGCRSLEHAIRLKNNPQMIYCFVDEVTDRNVTLCAPEMKYMDKQCKQLAFNLLDMKNKPKMIQDISTNLDKVEASWRKRIYNTSRPLTPLKRLGDLQTLNPNPHFVAVSLDTWARMLNCVLENNQTDLKKTMDNASVYPSSKGVDDVSTESINSIDIQPYTDFSLTFSHGQSLKGQMSCIPHKGCLSPQLTLYNMTNNVKLCLQHTDNPVLHLCRYSIRPTSMRYDTAKEYVKTWLPIMMMEAATEAVTNEECFIINNVAINFGSELDGCFSLSLAYCEVRNLDFAGIDDEEDDNSESRAYDWLCLKFTSNTENQATIVPNKLGMPKLKPVWVGHAEIVKVKRKVMKINGKDREEDGKLTVSFHLHKRSPDLPQEARQKKSKFSVEVLRKSEVDRRTEAYIKKLEEAQPESVSMKIALNIGKMPTLDPGHAHLAVIIERDFVVGSGDDVSLPKNNTKQQEAIDKALTERFSLIQGPPGTGKSYTGIKLMCLFNKINSIKHKEGGGKRHQVLFCGPSNKSVDLVARWMLRKLGHKMPNFVRVYGRTIEAMDFPVPGRTFQSRKSVHNLQADEQLRSVSLHHLIRMKGETYAEDITAMDRQFKANNYAPDPIKVKKYVHLIREASIQMIRKYDVILCTTAVGSNPKVLEASNIFQVIIDEAGMCPEPQCLVPILATEAKQVVLIGDHKQLRPIIKCKEAALLGLNTSLFERYSDNKNIPLTMLELQYRMDPEICSFPSKTFYDGKLITKFGLWKGEIIDIWPKSRGRQYPHVLVHVEGEEKALTVSTDEGNEQSKSNQEEIDIVVKVYKYLIQNQNLDAGHINVMSQYNAQVAEIKKRLNNENLQNFIVSTVVSSQGGEWDYVIFSTVRSLPIYKIEEKPTRGWCQKNLGFITDQNQINVALTRARKGIIIIGNKNLLRCDEVWKELIADYEGKGCIKTPDEFPPPKISRLEMMERQYQRTWERYGDSIYEPGRATSYEGPIDDDWNTTRRYRGRNWDRY